jgi:hypothetical protein
MRYPAKQTTQWLKLVLGSLILFFIAALMLFNPASLITSQQAKNDALIAESMAYHIGVSAYLYGYPLIDMTSQMHNETHLVEDNQDVYAPVNKLYRFNHLITPQTAGNLRAPNSDTLYFQGWYDITQQPLIIHTPDTQGRYFTIAITSLYAEVVHIGRRTTGTKERLFALVTPTWSGTLPDKVTPIVTETSKGWLLGRMLVTGSEDFVQANQLMEQIWLQPLGEFNGQPSNKKTEKINAQKYDFKGSLGFFAELNRTLKTLPLRPGEAALLAQFDEIGVGPNVTFDVDLLTPPQRKGLEHAIKDAEDIIQASTQRSIKSTNGWMISKDIGVYGYRYMHRASVVKGGYGNLPEESLYPAAVFDENGNLLNGSDRFRVHFNPKQLPPVDGFWSLSAYKLEDAQFEPNSIDRYSIGNLTKGLTYNELGGLTLDLQHEMPADTATNWLPIPEGHFMLVMRLYEPKQNVLDNQWIPPSIERL